MSEEANNPNPAPTDPGTPPASPTDPSPTLASPSDNAPTDPANPADPAAPVDPADPPKPEDPEAAAREAARAVKPEKAEDYTLTLSEKAQAVLGDLTGDPAMEALRKAGLEKGWTQGEFEDRVGPAIEILVDAGLIEPRMDFAAQRAALGDQADARMQEVETFAESLKTRGEIDDEEYAELTSLSVSAGGVRLIEKMRKWMAPGSAGDIKLPDNPRTVDPKQALQDEARAMMKDPKYATDNKFKREADRKWMEAFGG